MVKKPHSVDRGEATTPANEMALTTPDISAGAGQLRIITTQLEASIREIRSDIKDIKEHRHSDFRWLITVFAAGFLALATMFIVGYLRIEDRIEPLSLSNAKIDTKLQDLLARIPPLPLPPQH